jgi:hypothetical protein
MSVQLKLYISASTDLVVERDLLGRTVTEIPVDLNWRIEQSPRFSQPLKLNALVEADIHLLLLGNDIRAPIGQEWMMARRAGRRPVAFLKSDLSRTMAAQYFVRYIESVTSWRPFESSERLRQQVLLLLVGHILNRSAELKLSRVELNNLESFRAEVEAGPGSADVSPATDAADSSLILSIDRYMPSTGVLIEPDEEEE